MPRCKRKYDKGHKVVKSYADGGYVEKAKEYVEKAKEKGKEVLGLIPKIIEERGPTGDALQKIKEKQRKSLEDT